MACPPPPPPPMRSVIPPQTSIPLPVYYHSAEATYGTYRRRRPGNEAKDAEYYQLGKNPGIHGSQVEELTTSFDGRESSTCATTTTTSANTGVRTSLESTPAPERMLLGGREPQPQQQQQPSITRPFVPLDSTFTQTVKLKLPPSPNPGGPSMAHSSRAQLPHCTLPRSRGHKEVTFNPQATFQVYRRPSACYDGDEQL